MPAPLPLRLNIDRCITLLLINVTVFKFKMPSRRQEALKAKNPSEALIYFPKDRKTAYVYTRDIIQDKNVFVEIGADVSVNWDGSICKGKIIFMDGKYDLYSSCLID